MFTEQDYKEYQLYKKLHEKFSKEYEFTYISTTAGWNAPPSLERQFDIKPLGEIIADEYEQYIKDVQIEDEA